MNDLHTVISIFGSAGGVAKSVLSILNQSVLNDKDPIHQIITNSTIHLIDYKQKENLYYQGVYYVDELLLNTNNHYGQYLTCYMTDFVIGENKKTDGLLLNRMREFRDEKLGENSPSFSLVNQL
jgi:hypothetical protein